MRIITQERLATGAFLLAAALPLAYMMYVWRAAGDYGPHAQAVELLAAGNPDFFARTPHFLFHVLVVLVQLLTGAGTTGAIFVVSTAGYVLLAGVLYRLLRQETGSGPLLAGAAMLALLFYAPVNFFTPGNLYFGYFPGHVYHNPTMIWLRPLALLLFWLALRVFEPAAGHMGRPRWLAAAALLTVACIMAKPSYVIILLPALALLTLWSLLRRAYINWPLLLAGIVAPAGALLLFQQLVWTSGGVAFEPLRTFWEWSIHYNPEANSLLLAKLLLSLLFPLLVYGLHLRAALRSRMLNLAWLAMAFGLLYSYLLIETMEIPAGNFAWSAQIGALVLFAASAVFLLQQHREKTAPRWPLLLCAGVLGLHLLAGLHWYGLHAVKHFEVLIYLWW